MKIALIVDPELAFGFWLARGFDQAGYQGYPARSAPDALALLKELGIHVDLLILDPTLSGAAGLIEELRRSNELLRVVALIGDQPRLPALTARVDLCCRKPNREDEDKRREWIAHVEELLPASLLGAALDGSELLRKCAGALARHSPPVQTISPPNWKEWEGRLIDGQFRLERHLGGGRQSAVFLTQFGAGTPRAAAIKMVLEQTAGQERLLPRWERAAALSHPALVRLLGMGNCDSEGLRLHYLLMEYAEENLADVLRQRPLTTDETREMLDPVLDALSYIHSHGFVHGRVKPSNILAIADQLKLSSDGLYPAGETGSEFANRGVYDPPEATAGFVSPAADVWSLGITLVEALTQRPLPPKRLQHKPPALPVTLPPLFLDIARQCLEPDPERRTSIADLAGRLHEAPAGVAPPSVGPRRSWRPWYFAIPAVALGMALSGMLLVPQHQASPAAPPAAPPPVQPTVLPPVRPAAPPPVPAGPRHITDQSLPDISKESRETIQGTIVVRIAVRVDPSGKVVDATIETPGPSRYFANRALEAARYWKFEPLAEGNNTAEDWMLRFAYTADGTEASGARVGH
jgi:TonB family protein